jgi:SH3 domain-containing protein
MRLVLISLGVLGAGLYSAIAFTTSPSDRILPPLSAATNPKQAARSDSDTLQVPTATSQIPHRERSTPLPNDLAPVNTAPLSEKQDSWGEMLRNAPVHSGPDVSSSVLGYVAAGTEMQVLERKLGWVKVLDSATARQGWVYEKHVVANEGPDGIETGPPPRQEAALTDDAEIGASEKPARSFKSQKSRRKYVSKKQRSYGETRRRRGLGLFRFRPF